MCLLGIVECHMVCQVQNKCQLQHAKPIKVTKEQFINIVELTLFCCLCLLCHLSLCLGRGIWLYVLSLLQKLLALLSVLYWTLGPWERAFFFMCMEV